MIKTLFLQILFILVFTYIGLGITLFIFQTSFFYHPDSTSFQDCLNFQDAQKKTFNNTRFYYKQNSPNLAVFYHGNAGSACDRTYLKHILEKQNYSYIFVEYAGYSGDDKRPTKKLLLKDAQNINEFIKTTNYKNITLIGESVGTGIATYHSTLTKPDKVLLMAPFTNTPDLVKNLLPIYPISLMLKETYDNEKNLAGFKGHIHIIHGDKDNVIPYKFGKKLYENLQNKNKVFTSIQGAGHNDLYSFPQTTKAIGNFLKS